MSLQMGFGVAREKWGEIFASSGNDVCIFQVGASKRDMVKSLPVNEIIVDV